MNSADHFYITPEMAMISFAIILIFSTPIQKQTNGKIPTLLNKASKLNHFLNFFIMIRTD